MKPDYTILVVEDEDNDFFLVQRAFRKAGVDSPIQRASDGQVALEYLQGQGEFANRFQYPYPDVLLVDLKMPRMSGLELLAWIRDHPQHQVVPTIIMSSSEQAKDVEKAYELGANTYFVKPSDFDTLVDLVRRIYSYWEIGVRPRRESGR